MSINKYNSERYADPTAYAALSNIAREEKQQNKKPYIPIAFICSPFAGDTERNIRIAKDYCIFAVSKDYIPFAPHLLFPQFMDDGDREQRRKGIFFGTVFLSKCNEIWVFGDKITNGMNIEIETAKRKTIKIRHFSERCEEVKH